MVSSAFSTWGSDARIPPEHCHEKRASRHTVALCVVTTTVPLSEPSTLPQYLDRRHWRNVIQIPRRRGDRCVPELLRDDPDVAALGAKFGGMSMPQPVRVHPRYMAWFYAQPWFLTPGATFSLFIAGLLAVRHQIFEQPLAHKRVVIAMMVFGVVSWIVFNWLPSRFMLLGLLRD